MEVPPAQYSVRPARFNEAELIAAMIAVCDRSVGSTPTTLDSDLFDDWRREDFELERDTWIVQSPGSEIVAYATLTLEAPTTLVSFGAVHPDHRGRALGSYLIDRLEQAAEVHPGWRDPQMTLLNIILPGDKAAIRLLSARGYSKERTFQHMEIQLADFMPSSLPDSMGIHQFDPNRDREAMHALMESAFKHHWDYSPTPFEKWWSDMTGYSGFDPALWWWLLVDGHRAGALLGSVRDSQGWVMDLGVLDRWRGRGAGAALLRHAFGEFNGRGFDKVGLNVDSENETGATRLYERVGMKITRRFDFYKKVLVRSSG